MSKIEDRPSIGIILTQRQQIRVWLAPRFIAEISKDFSVHYFIDSDFKSECAEYDYEGTFVFITKEPRVGNLIIENLMIRHQKWPTFGRRANTLEGLLRNDLATTKFLKNPKTHFGFAAKLMSFKSRRRFRPILMFSNSRIQARLSRVSPKLPGHSLYVLVSNLNDYTNEIFESALRRSSIPWIQVAENWDNLSSKLCPSNSSDRLLVWGEQTKKHAMDIHAVSEDRIVVIGSPRFPNLIEVKSILAETEKYGSELNVFYAGYGGEHENYNWINSIDLALQQSRFKNQYSLTFRPHPNSVKQHGVDYFVSWKKNINLDMPTKGSNGASDWPALDKSMYKQLIKADIVIGAPSTFLLESLLFERYVILDYRDNPNILNSPKRNFADLTHLQEINDDSNFHRFETVEELIHLIDTHQTTRIKNQCPFNYFVHNETVSYESRLARVIKELLRRNEKQRNTGFTPFTEAT